MNVPENPHRGSFGAVRKHDIHTGVDLYADEGTEVFAVEDGTIVKVGQFTGKDAGSPWWLDTDFMMIEGESGVVLYGEIEPAVSCGIVNSGDLIGYVKRVLRNDKGLPTSMLHLELYETNSRDEAVWELNKEKPKCLRDPTFLLKNSR